MKNFKKQKFCIIKEAISKDLASFIFNYFLMKRQVAKTFFDSRYISPFETMYGIWTDSQVPNTYSHYADIAMETLLLKLKPIMEQETGLKLIENYSYARIYKRGDILERHKDRFSCEISTTLNLGGDPWPIYIEPNPKKGKYKKGFYVTDNTKGIEVILDPGDMLVYRGSELEHWREPFRGEDCAQVFLHYNNLATKGALNNIYDKRPHLGLPAWFKK
jgi:hypothetical protein